jgi:hypothetical protein
MENLVSIDRFGFGAAQQAITLLRTKDGEEAISQKIFRHRAGV